MFHFKIKFMRKLISLAILLIIFFSSNAQVPTTGLVAYYPFSDNANDQSGNNINGTVNGATLTTDRFGNANSAYSFNGTSNYIQFSDTKMPVGNTSRTFSIWTNFTGNSGWGSLLSYGKETATGNHNELLVNQNGVIDYDYYNINSISNDSIGQNNWYHIVYVFDNTAGTKIYVNGALTTLKVSGISLSASNISSINTTLSGTMMVGNTNNSNNYWYKGSIDDIAIYSRAITSAEVLSLYQNGYCQKTITVMDTLMISSTLGVNSIQPDFGTVKIYPNPSNSLLNVAVSKPSNNYTLNIYNSTGTEVYSAVLNTSSAQISLSSLGSAGLYIIRIYDSNNNILDTRKLIYE
jgi:hypothetical protein